MGIVESVAAAPTIVKIILAFSAFLLLWAVIKRLVKLAIFVAIALVLLVAVVVVVVQNTP
jgi:hypothetical protein